MDLQYNLRKKLPSARQLFYKIIILLEASKGVNSWSLGIETRLSPCFRQLCENQIKKAQQLAEPFENKVCFTNWSIGKSRAFW